jgi:hypothetical protein
LLRKLVVLKELDDYWVRAFLTASIKKDPVSVVALVMARLVEAKRRNDWSYEPLKKEHNGEGLGLMEVEAGPRLLRDFLDCALEESNDIPSARRVTAAILPKGYRLVSMERSRDPGRCQCTEFQAPENARLEDTDRSAGQVPKICSTI